MDTTVGFNSKNTVAVASTRKRSVAKLLGVWCFSLVDAVNIVRGRSRGSSNVRSKRVPYGQRGWPLKVCSSSMQSSAW